MSRAEQFAALATVNGALVDRLRSVDERFGVQHHADGTGPGMGPCVIRGTRYVEMANHYRDLNDRLPPDARRWVHILLEEVFEAVSEKDQQRLYDELVDVGAVVLGWLRDLELQRSGGTPAEQAHNDYANRVF